MQPAAGSHRATVWPLACLLGGLLGCGAPAADVATPDGAVTSTLRALGDGRPVVLWNSLSELRQNEVRKLLTEAAGQIDPELWERSVALLGKGARVIREKKPFAMDCRPLKALPVHLPPEELRQPMENLAAALESVATGELKTVDGLKNVDPSAWLSGAGAKTFGHLKLAARALGESDPFPKLSQARAVLIDESPEGAVVRIEYAGESPVVVSLAKVEGRWLPADLAPGAWDERLASLRTDIQKLPAWQAENKDRVIAQLKRADKALDTALAAKSQKEFDDALGEFSSALTLGTAGVP
jgi:hypothetical protein